MKHSSLRPRYETVFNQALVFLVSYFGSAVHDLFRLGIASSLESDENSPLLKENPRLTYREILDADYDLRSIAPDLLVQTKDISFQDMQSISRAFKDYLGIVIERTETVNEIVVAQACRHVVVHAGGIMDDKLMRQIRGAIPRTMKMEISAGDSVQYSINEVGQVASYMESYLSLVDRLVERKYGSA